MGRCPRLAYGRETERERNEVGSRHQTVAMGQVGVVAESQLACHGGARVAIARRADPRKVEDCGRFRARGG